MENIEKRRNVMKFVFVGIYIIINILGLVLMKLGGNPGSVSMAEGNINIGISTISLIGLICYVCSFLLFTRIVIMFDLSYIMPISTAIIQILTLIASKIVFKENFTTQGIIGASIIIIGVLIMNIKIK